MKKYERSSSETKFVVEKKAYINFINKKLNYLNKKTRLLCNREIPSQNIVYYNVDLIKNNCEDSNKIFLKNQTNVFRVYYNINNNIKGFLTKFKAYVSITLKSLGKH